MRALEGYHVICVYVHIYIYIISIHMSKRTGSHRQESKLACTNATCRFKRPARSNKYICVWVCLSENEDTPLCVGGAYTHNDAAEFMSKQSFGRSAS